VLGDLAAPLLNPLNNLRFVGFSLMFTALLVAIYVLFVSITRRREVDPRIGPGGT
jgi:hypothetical protein